MKWGGREVIDWDKLISMNITEMLQNVLLLLFLHVCIKAHAECIIRIMLGLGRHIRLPFSYYVLITDTLTFIAATWQIYCFTKPEKNRVCNWGLNWRNLGLAVSICKSLLLGQLFLDTGHISSCIQLNEPLGSRFILQPHGFGVLNLSRGAPSLSVGQKPQSLAVLHEADVYLIQGPVFVVLY